MMRRLLTILILSTGFFTGCKPEENIEPIEFVPIDLVAFAKDLHGFNLLGKYDVGWSNPGFTEEDFIIISELGFNFARLPLDYRTYTQAGNWDAFVDHEIEEIDRAVEWGRQYGVHVSICLHRAPGYCVNPTSLPLNQNIDLWTNPKAQEAFLNHWTFFANRYKDIPNAELSFNLVNEPNTNVDEPAYVNVMQKAIDKIHSINPNRVIFVDGLEYSRKLIMSLKNSRNIIQAVHAYEPFRLTHFKASWVDGSDTWPVPFWPMLDISQYLFGPVQGDYQSEMVLEGNFTEGTEVIINVHQVSNAVTLLIKLDDATAYSKIFQCGPDLGSDWTEIIYNSQWSIYQNISGKDYSVTLPAAGTKLTFAVPQGDWMTFNKITINSDTGSLEIVPGNSAWGSMQDTYKITSAGKITDVDGNPVVALGSIQTTFKMAEAEGIPIMIQEFGVHNQTPHDVSLAFLTDLVDVFRKNDIGYAMWNLTGSIGIINSDRADCDYEIYRGKELDRQMLEILQGLGN